MVHHLKVVLNFMAHKHIPSTGGSPLEWFGPGFGWTTERKVARWWDREYEAYAKRDGKLKVQAFVRYEGLLTYEARLDETISSLTSS